MVVGFLGLAPGFLGMGVTFPRHEDRPGLPWGPKEKEPDEDGQTGLGTGTKRVGQGIRESLIRFFVKVPARTNKILNVNFK